MCRKTNHSRFGNFSRYRPVSKKKCRFPVTVCVTHPLTSPKAQNCFSAVMVLLRTYLRISHSHYGCPLLGFYCKTNQVYEDFKAFVASQHSVLSSTLPANVNKMFQDFQATSVKQDLFEDIMLREDDAHGNDPLSFPRLLHRFAMDFAAQSAPDDFA